jgi:group I intron endonuclease
LIGIYKITNTVNGKVYIGQSVNIPKRIKQHLSNTGRQHNYYFANALKKYGADNFKTDVIALVPDFESKHKLLNVLEKQFIEIYNSANHVYGYNIKYGGDGGGSGHHMSLEARKKMSIAQKNRPPLSEEGRRNLSIALQGKAKSEAHKTKLSILKKGIKPAHLFAPEVQAKIKAASAKRIGSHLSEEARLKRLQMKIRPSPETIAKIKLARSYTSPEARRKISESKKGKKLTKEHVEKVRMAHLGKKHSPEWIANSVKGHLGTKRSEEAKQNMRDAWVRRKAREAENVNT